ncbi:uncharacterized protein LOC130647957 isoform X1 [Hydractinia symbiolongicarpus]|uniref:uncharacterized protein LOC130647957 isoform X1 n=1 Tax=Hydractinia symbiolongicarpus TaxID=13093 RepID=UPI0025502F69|nr:uncharacterized protein LOC130647957 isoform X1 [Hydractinia symbiolongicarpus]XP_057309950.1 uncharacterized protein LOC130647957 isoform X1 [Hydractinia symbiolongicarpus]
MKKTTFIVFFLVLLERLQGIPQRSNIFIYLDVNSQHHLFSYKMLRQVLEGISLKHHRVSLHTTTGVSVPIVKFQSRKCLLNKIRSHHRIHHSLSHVLKYAQNEVIDKFRHDQNYVLIITDRPLQKYSLSVLKKYQSETKNKGIYYVPIGRETTKELFLSHVTHSGRIAKTTQNLPFLNQERSYCRHSHTVRDECGRICKCVKNKMVDCYRLRKEFSSMTYSERMRYLSTYKALSLSEDLQESYLGIVSYHSDYFEKGIHERLQFFPWHRKYILAFENLLRVLDCHVTLPFWNWALYSKMAWSVTPSHHMWKNIGGFGGNGDTRKALCVTSGNFSYNRWRTPDYEDKKELLDASCDEKHSAKFSRDSCLLSFVKHKEYQKCLRRRFNTHPPRYNYVFDITMRTPLREFKKFENKARDKWHSDVHNAIGGHMESNFASNSPEFWLHHTMLDNIWDKWQKRGKAFKFVGYKRRTRPVTLLAFRPKEKRRYYVDNNNLGGCGLRIRYQNPFPITP